MSGTQMVLPIDKVVYFAQEVCAVVATLILDRSVGRSQRRQSEPRADLVNGTLPNVC